MDSQLIVILGFWTGHSSQSELRARLIMDHVAGKGAINPNLKDIE